MKVRNLRLLSFLARTVVVVTLAATVACTGPAVSSTDGSATVRIESGRGETIAASEDRLDRLAEARALLDEGQWDVGRPILTALVNEAADDEIHPLASIYLARCTMEESPDAGSVRLALTQVSGDTTLAADTRELADAYLAFLRARQGDAPAAGQMLVELLVRVPSFDWYLLAAPDRGLTAALLAEGQLRAGIDSLDQANLVMSTLERVALEAGEDETLLIYAYDRALEIAERRLAMELLAGLWETGTPFVRGTVAGAYVNTLIDSGDAVRAAEVLRATRDGMTALGLDFRARGAQASLSWSDQQSLRTGMLVSMTAGERQVGRSMIAGLLLAQRTFESEPPASTIAFADIAGDVARVEPAMRGLQALEVALVIGPPEPQLAARAREVAVELGIPLIDTSVVPLTTAMPGVVHVQTDPRLEVATGLGPALESGARTLVIVSDIESRPGSYQAALVESVYALADQLGLQVLEVPMDTASGSLQEMAADTARAIVSSGSDIVYFAVGDAPTAALAAHLANLGQWPAPRGGQAWWVGNSYSAGQSVRRDSARYVEGMIFPTFFEPSTARGAALTFVHRFEQVFGRSPSSLEAFSAVIATWSRELVAVAGGSALAVGDRMRADRVFDTMLGPAARDDLGNVLIEPALLTIEAGEYVSFERTQ
jgi:hypothetical protein